MDEEKLYEIQETIDELEDLLNDAYLKTEGI